MRVHRGGECKKRRKPHRKTEEGAHLNEACRTVCQRETALVISTYSIPVLFYASPKNAQERFTLRKIREIIRLKEESGLSNRATARAFKSSNSTVGEYLRRAAVAKLSWPLPEVISEEDLYRSSFPEDTSQKEQKYPLPDYEAIQEELKKKGVTLKLL